MVKIEIKKFLAPILAPNFNLLTLHIKEHKWQELTEAVFPSLFAPIAYLMAITSSWLTIRFTTTQYSNSK